MMRLLQFVACGFCSSGSSISEALAPESSFHGGVKDSIFCEVFRGFWTISPSPNGQEAGESNMTDPRLGSVPQANAEPVDNDLPPPSATDPTICDMIGGVFSGLGTQGRTGTGAPRLSDGGRPVEQEGARSVEAINRRTFRSAAAAPG